MPTTTTTPMLWTLTDDELLTLAQHHTDKFNTAIRCTSDGAALGAGLQRQLFVEIAELISTRRPDATAQLAAIEAQLVMRLR